MKKLLIGFCMLTGCVYQGPPPVPTPYGFMDGSILCCTPSYETADRIDLQCGKFKIERVTNFVRLPGQCRERKVEVELEKGQSL